MKLLTISIAAYKAEAYIVKALDSIIASKYIDKLQVIVVNDGSKDKTVNIVEEYVVRYPTIIDLIDKENGGYGSTINASLQIAKGRYYKLLDADDWFTTSELDKLVEALESTNADIVVSDYCRYYERNGLTENIKTLKVEYDHIYDIKELNTFNINPALTVKTQIIQGQIKITEKCLYTDVEFCVKAIIKSNNFAYYPYCIYCYRIGREGQSVSSEGRMKHIAEHEYIVKELYETAFDKIQNEESKNSIYRLFSDHIKYYAFYAKPNKDNLKRFISFCKYLKNNAPEAVNYLNKWSKKCYKHPKIYYLPTCIFIRCGHKVKKLFRKKDLK